MTRETAIKMYVSDNEQRCSAYTVVFNDPPNLMVLVLLILYHK